MTDILEYSDVAIPRERFTDELIGGARRRRSPSQLERRRRSRHRPAPLHRAAARRRSTCSCAAPTTARAMRAVRDYGDAIKELAAINIFAGDLLFKNFGVTRYGRVVFYDYDEIEYLTDCRFRTIPARAAGHRRHVGRGLVSGRPARHLSRGVRDVPADRSRSAARRSSRSTPISSTRAWWQAMQQANARRPRDRGAVVSGERPLSPQGSRGRGTRMRIAQRGEARARRCYARSSRLHGARACLAVDRRCRCSSPSAFVAGCQSKGPRRRSSRPRRTPSIASSAGERIVIHFDDGEARLLMPDGTRVDPLPGAERLGHPLHERPDGAARQGDGPRAHREQATMRLECKPYEIPTKKE